MGTKFKAPEGELRSNLGLPGGSGRCQKQSTADVLPVPLRQARGPLLRRHLKPKCRNPCLNDPARCGLESKQSE